MLENFFIENKIKPNIKEIHLGGGTLHLTVHELTQIINSLKNLRYKNLCEFSMEIDPRTVNFEHFDHYSSLE